VRQFVTADSGQGRTYLASTVRGRGFTASRIGFKEVAPALQSLSGHNNENACGSVAYLSLHSILHSGMKFDTHYTHNISPVSADELLISIHYRVK